MSHAQCLSVPYGRLAVQISALRLKVMCSSLKGFKLRDNSASIPEMLCLPFCFRCCSFHTAACGMQLPLCPAFLTKAALSCKNALATVLLMQTCEAADVYNAYTCIGTEL